MLDYSKRKCYGFVKNNDGEFITNEIEAQNVKLIFECFLNGMSLSEISKELHSQGVSSPSGKETWSRKVLSSTLSNEKYWLYGIIDNTDFKKAQETKTQRTNQVEETIVEIVQVEQTTKEKEEKALTVISEKILPFYEKIVSNTINYKKSIVVKIKHRFKILRCIRELVVKKYYCFKDLIPRIKNKPILFLCDYKLSVDTSW